MRRSDALALASGAACVSSQPATSEVALFALQTAADGAASLTTTA